MPAHIRYIMSLVEKQSPRECNSLTLIRRAGYTTPPKGLPLKVSQVKAWLDKYNKDSHSTETLFPISHLIYTPDPTVKYSAPNTETSIRPSVQ